MAIDDVRVAGVPLGSVPSAVDAAAGTAPASGATTDSGAREAESGSEAWSRPGAAPQAAAARLTRDSAPQPLARLQPGAPLVVDMEVADATAGSEVGVVWYAPDGRESWREKRTVGDEPRLAFSADTTGWPVGLYRGEIRYGRVPLHQFAVQVGTPAPQAITRERFPGEPPEAAPTAGRAPSGQRADRSTSTAGSPASAAGRETADEREEAIAVTPSAPREPAESAVPARPTTAAPVERLPSEEGAPVERIPPDDPNMVAPEGPPGASPEAPAEPDEDAGDDEPPPGGGA